MVIVPSVFLLWCQLLSSIQVHNFLIQSPDWQGLLLFLRLLIPSAPRIIFEAPDCDMQLAEF